MRRAFAVVVAASLLGSPIQAKKGVLRWSIKTSITATGEKRTFSLADFLALPEPTIPDGFDVQNKRIPKSAGDKASEGDIVTITGWLHLVAFEGGAKGDEDYHIQVSDSLTDGGDCVIVEAPNPAFITNKALAKKSSDIRLWVRTNLLHNAKKIPSSKGNPMEHPPFVKATGQLFFDSTHDEGDDPSGGRGKKGMKAGTIWELHPLTDLRFAPKPQ